ncbi:hypothetical protein AAVH_08093 [Aphelenchoides avenae]|nr:hypothetical protein AAVH_08093 [Aphelenchus avenae]
MDDSLAPTGRGPAKQGSGRRTTALPNSRISLSNEPSDINVASDAPRGSKKRKPAKPISLKLRYEKEFLAPEAVQRIADKASTHVPSPESSDQQVNLESFFDDGFDRYLDGLDATEWNQLFGPLPVSLPEPVTDSTTSTCPLVTGNNDAASKRKPKEPVSLQQKASQTVQRIADLASTALQGSRAGETATSSTTLSSGAQPPLQSEVLEQLMDEVESSVINSSRRLLSAETSNASIRTPSQATIEKNGTALKESKIVAKGPTRLKLRGPRMDRRTIAARKNLWSDAVLAVSDVDPSLIDVTTGIGCENGEDRHAQGSRDTHA